MLTNNYVWFLDTIVNNLNKCAVVSSCILSKACGFWMQRFLEAFNTHHIIIIRPLFYERKLLTIYTFTMPGDLLDCILHHFSVIR